MVTETDLWISTAVFILLEVMKTDPLMFTICYRPEWNNQWRKYPRNPLSHKCHRSQLRVRPLPSRTAFLLQHNKVSTLATLKLIQIPETRAESDYFDPSPARVWFSIPVSLLPKLWTLFLRFSKIFLSFPALFFQLNLFEFLNGKCNFYPLSETLPFSSCLFLRTPFKKPSLLWLVSSHRPKRTLQITKPSGNVLSFEANLT